MGDQTDNHAFENHPENTQTRHIQSCLVISTPCIIINIPTVKIGGCHPKHEDLHFQTFLAEIHQQ